jgi:hypothetical protein
MALTIIRVSGAANSHKSTIIREFTEHHLKYQRVGGDVLGVFQMPYRGYAVGVSGDGDTLEQVKDGLNFLKCYSPLRVIIVACHTETSGTWEYIARYAARKKAELPPPVKTSRNVGEGKQRIAVRDRIAEILSYMPPRS